LAAIGEKEWFFYVPRDRKYRNGDRPNRVTTSGYWKATGADRMIRTDNLKSIGLKKTLVFYSGKAPKGIRTSWIMNEYRLPQHDTDRYQKAEISLCRVYKRPGVEDHHARAPGSSSHSSAPASSSSRGTQPDKQNLTKYGISSFQQAFQSNNSPATTEMEKFNEADASSTSTDTTGTALGLANVSAISNPMSSTVLAQASVIEEVSGTAFFQQYSRQISSLPVSIASNTCNTNTLFSYPSIISTADDFRNLADYQLAYTQQHHQQHYINHQHYTQFMPSSSSTSNSLPNSSIATFSADKLWEWNPIPDSNRDN
ncbi:Nac domain-containing protein, partial [Thalictrum thalictroides]